MGNSPVIPKKEEKKEKEKETGSGGVVKLQMGANGVELACLSILNELSAGGRENLKPSEMLGLS